MDIFDKKKVAFRVLSDAIRILWTPVRLLHKPTFILICFIISKDKEMYDDLRDMQWLESKDIFESTKLVINVIAIILLIFALIGFIK